MKRNEAAGYYLEQYEDTDVIITAVSTFDGCMAFDLSDETHWFADDNGNYQVETSLVDLEIGWSDIYGWVIVNDDGTTSQIEWCE